MLNNNLNPFVGLKPYSKNTSNSYFGREQDVENLLQILQKNKLLTLNGVSGSGKTSLINSGLIPRLQNGFIGQAGKEWSITSFRPGINILLNLSHALTQNNVLKVDSKSNTTDQKYYSEIISNSGSMGVVEIYKRSDIFNKKNLLIIIDQLEDLFKYEKYFDSSKSEDDNNLMDIIYRSVTMKNTAIYFLICIETPYLSKLTSYKKLQEIISKSQYAIQNLNQTGINQILEKTFKKQNILFDSKVVDLFNQTLKEEISYLPNFQFLLYKLYEKFVLNSSEKSIIDLEDIEDLGGLEHSIAKDFETIYSSSTKENQKIVSLLFKAISSPQNNTDIQYESILNISEYTNSTIVELSKIIKSFKKTFNNLFDVFEPSITGISASANKTYDAKNILTLKYIKFLNWERYTKWLDEEKTNFKDFKDFSEIAIKKSNNQVGFLKTPVLERAIVWRKNASTNKNWAKKYKLNFEQTINFINESEQDDLRIKTEKENQLTRERNKDRRAKKRALIVAGFGIIGALITIGLWIKAKEAEKTATNASEIAKKAQNDAEEEKDNALSATRKMKIAKKYAEDERIKALSAQKNMEIAKKDAEDERNKALSAQKEAVDAKEEAIAKAEEARIQREIAQDESTRNKTLKELIELEADFKDLVIKLNSAYQENKIEDLKIHIDSSIIKQKRFAKLKQHESIESEEITGDESILKLNQKILTILKEKNSYGKTDMLLTKNKKNYSIRSFDILNNKKIAYAGDKGVINFYDIPPSDGVKSNALPISNIKIVENYSNIDDRIRNLVYVHDSILIATTFSKKVFKINPKKNSTLTLKPFHKISEYKNDILDFFVDATNNKQFLITTDYIITFNNYSLPTKNLKYKNIKATYFRDSKLFIVSQNKVFVIDENGNSEEILLDIDLNDMNIVNKLYVTATYLFLANENGNVFGYDYDTKDIKNKNPKKQKFKFLDHSSSITSMFLEEDKNLLFTASLDNKIFRYNIDYASEFIRNSKANFVGHEKWIWDMNTYTDKANQKFLITADEEGNLLKWYINPDEFLDKIELLYKKKYLNK